MANRYFNKQTTNARQALAQGGPAGTGKGAAPFKGPRTGGPRTDPRKRSGGPKMGRPSLGDDVAPKRKGRPPIPEFPKQPRQPSPGPKGGPKRPLPRFKKKDTTDREKIIRDRIKRNEIKDRLDKLKQKMKRGLDPESPKLKQLREQMKKMGGKK